VCGHDSPRLPQARVGREELGVEVVSEHRQSAARGDAVPARGRTELQSSL
jgi:hypothetical protein